MNKKHIETTISKGRVWDVANSSLYNLFSKNFEHDSTEKIIAKTWLLGRSYIVALERGKKQKSGNEEKNDEFYRSIVVKTFKNSKLDSKLSSLKKHREIKVESLKEILEVHKYLSDLVNKISRQNRSFASKYLHFHLPKLYFIYDSRANQRIKKLVNNDDFKSFKIDIENKISLKPESIDKEYYNFYLKCLFLKKNIQNETKKVLTTRELDDLLLY